jgi:hypothetical protein
MGRLIEQQAHSHTEIHLKTKVLGIALAVPSKPFPTVLRWSSRSMPVWRGEPLYRTVLHCEAGSTSTDE